MKLLLTYGTLMRLTLVEAGTLIKRLRGSTHHLVRHVLVLVMVHVLRLESHLLVRLDSCYYCCPRDCGY